MSLEDGNGVLITTQIMRPKENEVCLRILAEKKGIQTVIMLLTADADTPFDVEKGDMLMAMTLAKAILDSDDWEPHFDRVVEYITAEMWHDETTWGELEDTEVIVNWEDMI